MITVASTIGDYIKAISPASYLDADLTQAERTAELTQLRDSFGPIQGFAGETIGRNLIAAMVPLDTARDLMEQYKAEPLAEERAALAETAIAAADEGLAAAMQEAVANKSILSTESLALTFGVLHYAILTRQSVADLMEDGPMGTPELYETIFQASRIMFDAVDGTGISTAILTRLAEDIVVNSVQGSAADGEVIFNIISPISGGGLQVTVTQEGSETTEEFEDRIELVTAQQAGVVFVQEQQTIGAAAIKTIGEALNLYLPERPADVMDTHVRTGTESADTDAGTAFSDIMTGLGGDDLFAGGDGSDALIGGIGNDILRGDGFRDALTGGAGNDMIFGGSTRADVAIGDTARYEGLSTDYSVLGGTEYAVVIGPDGSRDKLFDISYLHFEDMEVALQTGSALDTDAPFETLNKTNFELPERVALLYEAALDRNGAIDLPGLNFYIGVTERDGLTDEFLAADLMTSPEFTEKFGDANVLTNEAFLERIYENVLDRASDAEGRQFYLDLLEAGTISKALALADIAVSPENTQGSLEVLMGLYETTEPPLDTETQIELAWSFVA